MVKILLPWRRYPLRQWWPSSCLWRPGDQWLVPCAPSLSGDNLRSGGRRITWGHMTSHERSHDITWGVTCYHVKSHDLRQVAHTQLLLNAALLPTWGILVKLWQLQYTVPHWITWLNMRSHDITWSKIGDHWPPQYHTGTQFHFHVQWANIGQMDPTQQPSPWTHQQALSYWEKMKHYSYVCAWACIRWKSMTICVT